MKRFNPKSLLRSVGRVAGKEADALRRASLSRSALWVAPVLALVCVVADYCLSNTSLPLFNNTSSLWLPAILTREEAPVADDVVMFDVAYDKELVPAVDSAYNDTLGVRMVTSRSRLLQMLTVLKDAPYRYLFVDVRFDAADRTDADSVLFRALRGMPRMSIPTHSTGRGYEIADTGLLRCAGYNDFHYSYFDDVSHYELLQYGRPSVAALMYGCLDGGKISRHAGIFYTSDGRLCYNNVFLPLTDIGFGRDRPAEEDVREDFGGVRRLTLGYEVLDKSSPEEIRNMVSGSIVLVGDFENDLHDTYVGEVPGAVMAYAAYRELHAGRHLVSFGYLFALFAVYTVIGLCMMLKNPLYDSVLDHYKINMWQCRFVLSLLGYGAVLYVAMLACYLLWGMSLNIKVPGCVFGLLALYISIKKSRR